MIRLGLVYDLRDEYLAQGYSLEAVAEFDTPATISELAQELTRHGCTVERIGNGQALAARLVHGERYDLVFSIAEGLHGRSREAQVPALCELYQQPYVFSDPLTLAVSLDKAVAKRLVRDAGIPTAPFTVLESACAAPAVDLPFPLFVKPLAEGTGKGCEAASLVHSSAELAAAAAALIGRFDQPVIVETYLPGREYTVGIVGTGADARVIGVVEIVLLEHAERGVYSYANKEDCEHLVHYQLVTGPQAEIAAEIALAAYRALGCRDAGRMDLRADGDGRLMFMEANPLAGLHPSHSDLPIIATLAGFGYQRLLQEILDSALRRTAPAPALVESRALAG